MVVQLHNHSHYSILDGRSKITEIIERVKELGQKAVALTDHGVMYGAIEFYKAAVEANIKPIIGLEAYVARESMFRKDPHADKMGSSWHITLLAMNEIGYKNLLKLTSAAHVQGFYFKPRIDLELLKTHAEGIFVLSGCMSGQLSDTILSGNMLGARKIISDYKRIFGDRYAIEVHNHEHPKQLSLNKTLFDLADETETRIVAACDSHYVKAEDAESHDAMLAIQTGSVLSDPNRFKITPYGAYYLRSEKEMFALFPGREYAVTNTEWVAEQCNLNLDFSKVMLPKFPIPEGHTPISWLRSQVYNGLLWRYGTINEIHKQRADYELSIIEKTGYGLYFLIVQDYVKYSRDKGVMAVPRGSVAGSLCIYALGICDIDPIKYNIMFERFLNDERKGMPDIDMDFADDSRDEVIRYVTEKYGSNRVAHIGTFQTMGAKAAFKDVARVKGLDFGTSNGFTKLFPDRLDITLAGIESDQRIQSAISSSPEIAEIFRLAKELEGVTRGFGTHAAGILISDTDLDNVVPIQLPPEKGSKKSAATVVTQYDNNNQTSIIESIGLSKFDFLGLSNLSIIRDVCKLINKRHGINLYGDSGERLYSNLPIDVNLQDAQKAYSLLSAGETTAVFQTESPGMRRVLRLVQPTKISDIAAIVALYRPGPMDYVPVFADAKHGRVEISYLHPDLRPILEETYGVVVYQDQVLLIARKFAGFSWGEVDALRKGMGKKNQAIIDEQKQKFLAGCVAKNYSEEIAIAIWEQIAPFAGYGFNRAHAFCYGYVAYITAFLKSNFPEEYMATVLTHESQNKDKIAEAISECKRMGIPVLPPNINISESNFTIASIDGKPSIVFGLSAVMGVGAGACKTITQNRSNGGIFTSLPNFLNRIDLSSANLRAIGNLIKSGALDDFGERKNLLINLSGLLEANRNIYTLRSMGQTDMFSDLNMKEITLMPNKVNPMTRKERLDGEFETLGIYISEHPLDDVRDQMELHATHTSSSLEGEDGKECIVGGIITRVKLHSQKDGKPMAFVTLQDYHGEINAIVFNRTFEKIQKLLTEETRVIVRGGISERNGEPSIRVDDVIVLDPSISSKIPAPALPEVQWNIAKQKVSYRIHKLWRLFESEVETKPATMIHLVTNKGSMKFEVNTNAPDVQAICG